MANQTPLDPNTVEGRKQMVQAADIDGLWQLLLDTPASLLDTGRVLKDLLSAIDVASRADPSAFSRKQFARMVGFSTWLCLRGQLAAAKLLTGQYGSHRPITDQPIRDLIELQQHTAELLFQQAATERMWSLATNRASRTATDVVAPNRKERSGTNPQERHANPDPVARKVRVRG